MKVLVMGGTRFMGRQTVLELLRRGHQVTVFNRGTQNVAWEGTVTKIHGDRNDPEALGRLLISEFEAVVDFSGYTGAQVSALLDIMSAAPRWVHCSSGAVYQPSPTLPWDESTPYGPWALWGTYAAEKLNCELVLEERRPADLATSVLRLPYVLGPRNYADREEFVLNRLLDDATILLPGDGQAVQQFVHIRQVAEAMANAVERAPAGWHAYNIATPQMASLEGFVRICADVVGRQPNTFRLGNQFPAQEPFNAADPVFPFPNHNYMLNCAAAAEAGIAPGPMSLRDMIDDALEALMAGGPRREWKRYAAESEAMAAVGIQ